MGRRTATILLTTILATPLLAQERQRYPYINSPRQQAERSYQFYQEFKARKERERRETERRFHESEMEYLLREQNDILRNQGVKIQ